MKLRGIGPNARNLLTRPLAVAEYVFVPMMLRSATIAEELSAAAATRGIDSVGRRTSINELGFHASDIIAVAAFTALALRSLL
jgi:energy-coupling factor transport system permease protein